MVRQEHEGAHEEIDASEAGGGRSFQENQKLGEVVRGAVQFGVQLLRDNRVEDLPAGVLLVWDMKSGELMLSTF